MRRPDFHDPNRPEFGRHPRVPQWPEFWGNRASPHSSWEHPERPKPSVGSEFENRDHSAFRTQGGDPGSGPGALVRPRGNVAPILYPLGSLSRELNDGKSQAFLRRNQQIVHFAQAGRLLAGLEAVGHLNSKGLTLEPA